MSTDLAKGWCPLCELEWDVWGTEAATGFVPERDEALQCPTCLLVGDLQGSEDLS